VTNEDFFNDIPPNLKSKVRIFNLDISKDAECKKLCEIALKEFGTLDILVNSAAVHISQEPDAITDGVYTANPKEILYLSAKAGVEASTRAFARLGAPDGITIPSRIPLGRAGKIDELVGLVLYLSSEISEYITGQVIPLNGGRLMK